jgi:hypothetical protein
MTSPGLGSGSGITTTSLQKIVETGLLRPHLRAPYRIRHDRSRLRRPMGPPCRGDKPVIVIGRHQYKFAPAMPRDFYRLPLGLVLELAEFTLELHCGGLSHDCLEAERTSYLYNTYYLEWIQEWF